MNMTTAIYIRVSTKDQGTDGHSLDYQLSKIEAYCSLHDLTFDPANIFEDVDSGSHINRKELQRLLANKKSYTDLVILKLDRLTRCGRDFYTLKDELFDEDGLTLHSVEDHINTSTPIGKAMIGLLLTYSEFEIDTLKLRTKNALKAKRAKGEPMGTAPYGYKYDNKKLVKHAGEQAIIRKMKRLKAYGYTLKQIQQILYEKKLYSRGLRGGKKFTTALIHKLTKNITKGSSRTKYIPK